MPRKPFVVLVGAVVAISLAFATTGFGQSVSATMGATKLKGTVGPKFTISLTKGGKTVKTLKPGAYTFVISDKASIHNFTLEQEKGGHFEKHLTTTPFVGTKTVTVTLKKGSWKYYCSVHESLMHGEFTVK